MRLALEFEASSSGDFLVKLTAVSIKSLKFFSSMAEKQTLPALIAREG
jgi:hypothetical protein